jgi:hypothetical protein
MKKQNSLLLFISVLLITFSACKKDDEQSGGTGSNTSTGSAKIIFNNMAGSVPLNVAGDSVYTNSSGETFTVTALRYYVSNFSFVKDDGTVVTLPADYYLIDQSGKTGFKRTISGLPVGSYKGVRFLIGVDSAKTVQGAQTGDLDPSNGMVWDWNTGYIFVKLEGNSPVAGTIDSTYQYHISGYKTSNNTYALHWADISFGSQPLVITTTTLPQLNLKTDILEFFRNPYDLSIVDNPVVTASGTTAVSISNNYADMFSFDHIQN